MMPCLPDAPPIAAGELTDDACVSATIDVAGGATAAFPSVGVSRTLDLARAQARAIVRDHGIAARVGLGAVRSGGSDGYIGVAGESIVPQVQLAEARVDTAFGLRLSGGFLDDPWVAGADAAWGPSAVVEAFPLSSGWYDRSDLALGASWTAARQLVSIGGRLASGEGLARRERNDGKDASAIIAIRPFTDHPERLAFELYGRDGSRGLSSARDHRVGARVTAATDAARGGVELDKAWGVEGDPARAPIAASAWGIATPGELALVLVRCDAILEVPRDGASGHTATTGAIGATWRGTTLSGRVIGGGTVRVWGADARPVAGAAAEHVDGLLFIRLQVQGALSAPLSEVP